jgi:hypothetical protein
MHLLLDGVGRSKAGADRNLAARFVVRAAAPGRAIGFSGAELREAGAGENRDAAWTVWIFLVSASFTLSLGAMTWPHQVVRVMAAEPILPGDDDSPRSPLSSSLIRELAGVLPRRRHFPLLEGAMRLRPVASPTGHQAEGDSWRFECGTARLLQRERQATASR